CSDCRPAENQMQRRYSARVALCAAAIAVTATASLAQQQRGPQAPEIGTGIATKQLAMARRHMVAAANPFAVEAGLEMLAAGGTAMDAAVAVQLVLNVVEPQSSGIGGGAFLLHFNSATAWVQSYDGRETAPSAARPNLFLKPDGTPR